MNFFIDSTEGNRYFSSVKYLFLILFLPICSYAEDCNSSFSEFDQEPANKLELANMYWNGLYGMNRDRTKALELYEELQHYPPAQYTLGKIFLESQEVSKKRSGFFLIRESASEDYFPAILKVASLFLRGVEDVVHQSYEQALFWLEKAVQKNYPPAQYLLAKLYDETNLKKEAFSLMEQAAQQGLICAQAELSFMYLEQQEGVETPQSKERGEYWHKKAQESLSQLRQIPFVFSRVPEWLKEYDSYRYDSHKEKSSN